MSHEQFLIALRSFSRRRPFRPFWIEFNSGERLTVGHPEAVIPVGKLYFFYGPDRKQQLMEASSVCRLLDPPKS